MEKIVQNKLLIKVDRVTFKKRLFTHFIDSGTLLFLILIIYGYKSLIFSSIFIIILSIYLLVRYNESKIYITDIIINEPKKIEIIYDQKNYLNHSEIIHVSDLKFELREKVKGSFFSTRLLIFNRDKLVLKQFQIGKWDIKKMNETIQIFKKVNNI